MAWELLAHKTYHAGKWRPRSQSILVYGYLTGKGGMKVRWMNDYDRLQTTEIIAINNMSQAEIDKAMKEFRQMFPPQDSEEVKRILNERERNEKERQEYIRDFEKTRAARIKYLAEKRAEKEEKERLLNSRQKKYEHIK